MFDRAQDTIGQQSLDVAERVYRSAEMAAMVNKWVCRATGIRHFRMAPSCYNKRNEKYDFFLGPSSRALA